MQLITKIQHQRHIHIVDDCSCCIPLVMFKVVNGHESVVPASKHQNHHVQLCRSYQKRSSTTYKLAGDFHAIHRVMEPNSDRGYYTETDNDKITPKQNTAVDMMEAALRLPTLPDAIADAEQDARHAIKEGINSEAFHQFIHTTKANDGQQWPIATISADQIVKLQLPGLEQAKILRLDSRSVSKSSHRDRYRQITWDWGIVQDMIDNGESMPSRDNQIAIWHTDSTNKKWLMFIEYSKATMLSSKP